MNQQMKGINHQLADPNDPPEDPKAAATVLLVRDKKPQGIEVFLIERAARTNFGGAFVFPGGKVDLEDGSEEIEKICKGPSDLEASFSLGIDSGGLAYWVACIRECYEEAGILLAYRKDGSDFNPENSNEKNLYIDYRKRLNQGESILQEMSTKEEILLATNRLAYLSHWITPKIEKKRYTTRFFVAQAPSGQTALHDGNESINSLWISPEDALEKHKKRELLMLMPTIKNLETICGYRDTDTLLKEKISMNPKDIRTIEPKFFMEDGKLKGVLPGEPGYDEH